MIQPISSFTFKGQYNPHCVSPLRNARAATLKDDLRPLIDPIAKALKTEDRSNVISKSGDTLYHTLPDGNLMPVNLKELKDDVASRLILNTKDKISEVASNSIQQTTFQHILPDDMTVVNVPVKTHSEIDSMSDTVSEHSNGTVIDEINADINDSEVIVDIPEV